MSSNDTVTIRQMEQLLRERERLVSRIERFDPRAESDSDESPSPPAVRIAVTGSREGWNSADTEPISEELSARFRQEAVEEWRERLRELDDTLRGHNVVPA